MRLKFKAADEPLVLVFGEDFDQFWERQDGPTAFRAIVAGERSSAVPFASRPVGLSAFTAGLSSRQVTDLKSSPAVEDPGFQAGIPILSSWFALVEGAESFAGLNVTWPMAVAKDQGEPCEDAELWAEREGLPLAIAALSTWLGLDSAEPVRTEAARRVVEADSAVKAEERRSAGEFLAPALAKRWRKIFEGETRGVAALTAVVVAELRRLSRDDANKITPENTHCVWLKSLESGLFDLPAVLKTLALAWWESEERAEWRSRKTPALTTEVFDKVARLTAPSPTRHLSRRSSGLAREVWRDGAGLVLSDEFGPVARSVPVPAVKLSVVETALKRLETTEYATRLLFEFVARGAEGRIDLEYRGFRGLAQAVGAPWNGTTRETLRAALDAMRSFELDGVSSSRYCRIRGLLTYGTSGEYDGFGARDEDALSITLSVVLRPKLNYGARLVPFAPPPDFAALGCGTKARARWANLCLRLCVLLSERSDEVVTKGGAVLFSKPTLRRLGREARLEPDELKRALTALTTGDDSFLVETGEGEARPEARRFSFGSGSTYRPYREFIEEQGRRRVRASQDGLKSVATKKARRAKGARKASGR
jgi:hypothetical protein